ncbi:hypothetical protein QAD02_014836 [Eretmocerus hayati]|uniref:Uncharacterized protein n=1 Tax=Eretmocerus hayati TaxID=131215 RepID=A0ACC2P6Z5_9HYME|nr:hypothetical protein QAD02_014836 [Eretmocerus hayati]
MSKREFSSYSKRHRVRLKKIHRLDGKQLRKENPVLAHSRGIWIGAKKPIPNLFLEVFRDSLKRLYRGVYFKTDTGEHVKCRSQIICGTCDLGAKCLFLNLKQHNGFHGCHTCKIRGEPNPYTPNTRVYPYVENLQLRTSQETVEFAKELQEKKKVDKEITDIFGVKGPSILAEIVHDYINTTTIDIMHLYINIMKRLMAICLPILKKFMPAVYFQHHILLVYGLTMLNMSSISEQMMGNAGSALNDYVKIFETLYGIEHMTMCIHLLLHLVDAVRKFGPLFVTSCFPFENLNGILKSFVHGSKYPELQIHASLSLMFNLTDLKASNLIKNEHVLSFCDRVEKRSQMRRKLTKISDKTYVLGSWYKKKHLTELKFILRRVVNNSSQLHFFRRLFMSGTTYETRSYSKNKKKNSSCCIYSVNGTDHIGMIKNFVRVCDCNSKFPKDCESNISCKSYALVSRCRSKNVFSYKRDQFIPTIFESEECNPDSPDVISLGKINHVCFTLDFSDNDVMYAVKPCNFQEVE